MLKTLLWTISLGVLINISPAAYAQQHPPQLLAALQELERQSGKKWLVTWNDEGTSIKHIELAKQSKPHAKTKRKDSILLLRLAMGFLRQHHALFQVPADLKDLQPEEIDDELNGRYDVYFQQFYKGLKVRLKNLRLEVDRNSGVIAVDNDYLPNLTLSITPRISREEIFLIAQKDVVRYFAWQSLIESPMSEFRKRREAVKIELYIETLDVKQPLLAYSIEFGAFSRSPPDPAIYDLSYDIDANTGRRLSSGRTFIDCI